MPHIRLKQLSDQGAAVILIHGFLGNSVQWQPIAQVLQSNYSVYTIDLPGHGSNTSLEFYTLTDLAKDLVRDLNERHIDLVHVIGHSMGGYVGSAFAKAHPEKIASLTLLNSIAGADSAQRLTLRNRSLEFIERYGHAYTSMAIANLFTDLEKVTHTAMIENLKNAAAAMNLIAVKNAIIAMRDRVDALHMLDDKGLNINYIAGTQDTILPIAQVRKEAVELNKPIAEIDSGHMSLLTSPELIIERLPFIE
ncbi:alpha/beta fold hydrolase [Nonlabens ponticola]|uniref:Alpha/beta hydrolase n=1 Tax=Nonlabens ponticola TaxID=2496866 RepID=A0A3S9MV38_9FLAO|nr:alpha/beta hydrolase [Nonlabens ponticola]AZQ43038.1 alpha/beta hydrolase [Nonlabens ponticola]